MPGSTRKAPSTWNGVTPLELFTVQSIGTARFATERPRRQVEHGPRDVRAGEGHEDGGVLEAILTDDQQDVAVGVEIGGGVAARAGADHRAVRMRDPRAHVLRADAHARHLHVEVIAGGAVVAEHAVERILRVRNDHALAERDGPDHGVGPDGLERALARLGLLL